MNYNKHLEELNKYRDQIRELQQVIEGMGIDLGNYIDEVEEMRDDYHARSKMDFPDGDHLSHSDDDKLETDTLGEQLKKKRQVLAGIK